MNLPSPTTRLPTVLAAVLLLGTGLAGCLSGDASASSGEIYVKDALTDEAAEVHVTFTKAEVLPDQASEWVPVYEGEQTIELLSLSGSDDRAKLSGFEIDPGEYTRLRLTIQNVTVEHKNGTTQDLAVFGNVVTVGQDLTYEPGEELSVTLDFDLDRAVNLTSGEYVPVVGDVQRSDVDSDQDGQPDFVDTDDDGDGIEDAEDEDRDGDGQPDLPEQSQAMDKQGLFGLCTAWTNSDEGRENGTAANSTAFTWLADKAENASLSVEAYCEEQTRPGAPDDLSKVMPEDLPEQARQAVEDVHLGPPEDAQDRRDGSDDRGEDARSNRTTAEDQDRRGNDTRDGDQADNRTGEDGASQANQTGQNDTAEDGNQTRDGQP